MFSLARWRWHTGIFLFFFHCPCEFMVKAVKFLWFLWIEGLWFQIHCIVCNYNFKGYLIVNILSSNRMEGILLGLSWKCPAKPCPSDQAQNKCCENSVLHRQVWNMQCTRRKRLTKEDIFNKKTALFSSLRCYGAPCIYISNSYG